MPTLAEIDKLQELSVEVKKQIKLLKQSPVVFSNTILMPTEVVWIVNTEVLEQQVKSLVGTYLDAREVQDVTIWREPERRKVAPKIIVWLRSNSKHLIESSERRDDQLLSPVVERYSQELKELCDQFAPTRNEQGHDIPRKKRIDMIKAINNRDLVGIKLDFLRVMDRLFDKSNKGFIKVWGKDSPNRVIALDFNPIYERGSRDTDKMVAFRITKSYGDKLDRRRPVPAFRDRRDA